jgi:hypothetical protein
LSNLKFVKKGKLTMRPYRIPIGKHLLRSIVCSLLFFAVAIVVFAEEAKVSTRPITDADAVLAVYHEDWCLNSAGEPAIILVAWPDGHIVWSGDRVKGGAPYRVGQIDPEKVALLLKRFDRDGLFADEKLSRANFGPDSAFTTLYVKSGKNKVEMNSWHELAEESGSGVADHHGISSLQGQHRLAVLRESPAEYLFFRFVWSETRGKLASLIPSESTASAGKPIMEAGVLSWHDEPTPPAPKNTDKSSRK